MALNQQQREERNPRLGDARLQTLMIRTSAFIEMARWRDALYSLDDVEAVVQQMHTFDQAVMDEVMQHATVNRVFAIDTALVTPLPIEAIGQSYETYNMICRFRGDVEQSIGRPAAALLQYTKSFDYVYAFLLLVYSNSEVETAPNAVTTHKEGLYSLIDKMCVCLQTLGRFEEAIYLYDRYVLNTLESDRLGYKRELAVTLWSALDKDLSFYQLDDQLEAGFKSAYVRGLSYPPDSFRSYGIYASKYSTLPDTPLYRIYPLDLTVLSLQVQVRDTMNMNNSDIWTASAGSSSSIRQDVNRLKLTNIVTREIGELRIMMSCV